MGWYRVVKTVKGRRYAYLQRSWREGKRVRTESRYLGPVGGADHESTENGSQAPKPTKPAPVITTEPEMVAPSLVRRTFRDLTRPLEQKPDQTLPFEGDRHGKNLVKKNPTIERVIADLAPRFTHQRAGAFYRPREDLINIPPMAAFHAVGNETATEGYYATVLHELTHWTGEKGRLKRRGITHGFAPEPYAREELVAEGTAMILMRHFGIAPSDPSRHIDYFQHWLEQAGDREEALAYAEEEAAKAANFIIGVITT